MEIGLFQTGSSNNYVVELVEWDICEIPTLKPMFSGSPNPMDLLPIMTDNGGYPEIEIGLIQTGSSNKYAAERVIREIPTLKPMFSGSPITMVVSLILFDTDY
mgnify:CR=1 FL=1